MSGPPCTRLKAPAGSPAASTISASAAPVEGDSSDGLKTTALPAISAELNMPTDSATGKLNGAITPKTPYGRSTSTLRSPST